MDYSIKCPQCGKRLVYYSHEIGTTGECDRCKTRFDLPENSFALARLILWAIGGLIGIVLFFVAVSFPAWQVYFFPTQAGKPPVQSTK